MIAINKSKPKIKILTKKFFNKKYLSWLNSKKIRENIDLKKKITLKDLKEFYKKNRNEGNKLYGIFYSNRHIGNINIKFLGNRKCYIGYIIGEKKFQSKGIATYSVNLASKKCFVKYNANEIFSNSQQRNTSSIRVLEKNNFKLLRKRPKYFHKYVKRNIKVNYYLLRLKNFKRLNF